MLPVRVTKNIASPSSSWTVISLISILASSAISSSIVTVAGVVFTPTALLSVSTKVIITVSLPSTIRSSITSTEIVTLLVFAGMVTVTGIVT